MYILTELNKEEDEEDFAQFLRLQCLEQSQYEEGDGGHEEGVVEDGGEDGARPVVLGDVVGDEVRDEESRETDGGVDEGRPH